MSAAAILSFLPFSKGMKGIKNVKVRTLPCQGKFCNQDDFLACV